MYSCMMGLVSNLSRTTSPRLGEDLSHTAPCLILVVQFLRAAASLLAATGQN